MSFKKQKIAMAALAISIIGTIITYSSTSFFGLLLYHAFLASLVGGFADWFAVVALFRKPLGFISYHTEILKRNRARIMDEIVNFVTRDVLSADNIMRVIKKEHTGDMLSDYLFNRGGKERVMAAAREILTVWLKNIDTNKISHTVANSAKDGLLSALDRKNASKILNFLRLRDREILHSLANIFEEMFKSENVQKSLKSKIAEAIEEYQNDSVGRAMLIGFLDLNEDKVLKEIEDGVFAKLNEVKKGEGESYENLRKKLDSLIEEFRTSESFDKNLDIFKGYIKKDTALNEKLNDVLQKEFKSDMLKMVLLNFLQNKLEELEKDDTLSDQVDIWIKNFIRNGINTHHEIIENLVRERLDKFSDDEFTNFVEEKVNDDLQIIRVNGAVVGGALGALLYIVVYAAERILL